MELNTGKIENILINELSDLYIKGETYSDGFNNLRIVLMRMLCEKNRDKPQAVIASHVSEIMVRGKIDHLYNDGMQG